MNSEPVERKAGRPRAVSEALIPEVLPLYRQGLGYRVVARELREEDISVDWSTIRRIVKAHIRLEQRGEDTLQTNSDTILTLGEWPERLPHQEQGQEHLYSLEIAEGGAT